MDLLHKLDKELVARLQILLIRHTADISRSMGILCIPILEQLPFVLNNLSEMRVHIVIILDIVLMIRRRHKNRIQVNDLYSQILQVIQLIHNPLQISAVKAAHIHRLRQFIPALCLFGLLSNITVFSGLHVIGWVPVAEAVHKDLIHYRPFRPVGRRKSRNNAERVVLLQFSCHAQLIIVAGDLPASDFKVIMYCIEAY